MPDYHRKPSRGTIPKTMPFHHSIAGTYSKFRDWGCSCPSLVGQVCVDHLPDSTINCHCPGQASSQQLLGQLKNYTKLGKRTPPPSPLPPGSWYGYVVSWYGDARHHDDAKSFLGNNEVPGWEGEGAWQGQFLYSMLTPPSLIHISFNIPSCNAIFKPFSGLLYMSVPFFLNICNPTLF